MQRLTALFGKSWRFSRACRKPQPRQRRVRVEKLEDRFLLSTVSVSGGVLQYTAVDGVENHVVMSYDSALRRYTLRDAGEPILVGRGLLKASQPFPGNSSVVSFSALNVSTIQVFLKDRGDTFVGNLLPDSSVIDTGTGDDRIFLQGNLAPAAIKAGTGNDKVVVDDATVHSAASGAHSFVLTHKSLTRDGQPVVNYDTSLETLQFSTAEGSDTVQVRSTSPATAIEILLYSDSSFGASDTVAIGNHGSLDQIQGPVSVSSLGFTAPDVLTIDDTRDGDDNHYSLMAGSLVRDGAAPIKYAGLEEFRLNTGSGHNTVKAAGTDHRTTVTAGAGDHDFLVGNTLDNFQLPLTLIGGPGINTLTADDSATTRARHYGVDFIEDIIPYFVLSFTDIWGLTKSIVAQSMDQVSVKSTHQADDWTIRNGSQTVTLVNPGEADVLHASPTADTGLVKLTGDGAYDLLLSDRFAPGGHDYVVEHTDRIFIVEVDAVRRLEATTHVVGIEVSSSRFEDQVQIAGTTVPLNWINTGGVDDVRIDLTTTTGLVTLDGPGTYELDLDDSAATAGHSFLVEQIKPYTVVNSIFDVTIDGRFSGSVQNGVITGEWGGIAPVLFSAPPVVNGILLPALAGDPRANVYAPVGLGEGPLAEEFYALQAFQDRTDPNYAAGEFVADIRFPILVGADVSAVPPPGGGERFLMTLQVRGDGAGGFDFLADFDGDGVADATAAELGIEAAAGFGPSPLSNQPHLIVELEMPLNVPAGLGDLNGNFLMDGQEVFPPEGLAGRYSFAPALWSSQVATDGDQVVSATEMFVSFDRKGITTASADHLMLEPSHDFALTVDGSRRVSAAAMLSGVQLTTSSFDDRGEIAGTVVPLNWINPDGVDEIGVNLATATGRVNLTGDGQYLLDLDDSAAPLGHNYGVEPTNPWDLAVDGIPRLAATGVAGAQLTTTPFDDHVELAEQTSPDVLVAAAAPTAPTAPTALDAVAATSPAFTLNTGLGADQIHLLADISNWTLDGGGYDRDILYYDGNTATSGRNYYFLSFLEEGELKYAVGRVGTEGYRIRNINSFIFEGTRFNDTVTLADVPPGMQLHLDGGDGIDTIYGSVEVNEFHITGINAGYRTLAGDSHTFFSVENLVGGAATDYFIFDLGGQLSGAIDGAGGTDALVGPLGPDNVVNLTTLDGGTLGWDGAFWTVPFASIESIAGGGPADHFIVHPGGGISANIDGYNGSDILDYSSWTDDVVIDAAAHTAPGIHFTSFEVLIGGSGDDLLRGDQTPNVFNNLFGLSGNDILIGGQAADTLSGGDGRDILIGGLGLDFLDGGLGDDILIGGTTLWDHNNAGLSAIRTLWTAVLPYEERVASLRPAYLNHDNVLDDAAADSLYGGDDLDWFWGNIGVELADWEELLEIVN